jgi:ribulose-phosphate 3-epimerase
MFDLNQILIAPSILSADPLNMERDLKSVEGPKGADWHHIDVMDGHFVPNLTFGLPLVKALKKITTLPLDVHIMVSNPDDVADQYLDAGADILTFHVEASKHPHRLIQTIKSSGRKAGIALNPGTALELCFPLLNDLDIVMLMSVNPGFGGQSFIPEAITRTKNLASELKKLNRLNHVRIEVDGGITTDIAKDLIAAGASVLVAGTSVYRMPNRIDAIKALRGK